MNTKREKNTGDTFITGWIMKFDKARYETAMCLIAGFVFLILPLKLCLALVFHCWNELLWVQLLQLSGVAAVLVMLIYLAHVYKSAPQNFWEKGKYFMISHKWVLLFAFFVLWMVLSFLVNKRYADYKGLSDALYGMPGRNEGMILRTLEFCLMAGFTLVCDKGKKRYVLNILLAASCFLCIPVLAQEYDWFAGITGLSGNADFQYMTSAGRNASVLSYFNHYGYYLCVVILLAAGLLIQSAAVGYTVFYLVCFAVNVFTLAVNNTFGSWLAAAAALFVISILYLVYFEIHKASESDREFRQYRTFKIIAVFLLFFLISGIYEKNGQNMFSQIGGFIRDVNEVAGDRGSEAAMNAGTGRWRLWTVCAGFIMEKPVFGWCEDGIAQEYRERGFFQDRPANEYLEYAAFYGLPAVCFYICALVIMLMNRIKGLKRLPLEVLAPGGAVIAYLISACFGNTTNYVTLHFFILLGFAMEVLSGASFLFAKSIPIDEQRSGCK